MSIGFSGTIFYINYTHVNLTKMRTLMTQIIITLYGLISISCQQCWIVPDQNSEFDSAIMYLPSKKISPLTFNQCCLIYFSLLDDPCDPQPCLNDGTCTDTGLTFSCECTVDFTGTTCQQQAGKHKEVAPSRDQNPCPPLWIDTT